MASSRYLNPTTPGALLASIQGLLTAGQTLVVQSIASGTYFIFNETPSGTIDGANVTFTLAHAPNPANSLELYVNGVYMSPAGNDYTLAGATITFVLPPQNASNLKANYTNSPV